MLSFHSYAEQELSIKDEIAALKKQVIALNRDLFILEEDLLYPASTQVAVYLAMDVGQYFQLDSIELKIDGNSTTHYLYTEKQLNALYKGGVQRLYLGNVSQGEHEITAFFIGTGPNKREYKRATTAKFIKTQDAKAIELKIVDSTGKEQAEFLVSEL